MKVPSPNHRTARELPQDGYFKNKRKNKCWSEYGEIRTLMYCWWGFKIVSCLGKRFASSSKKLNTEFPYDPVASLLAIYSREFKVHSHINERISFMHQLCTNTHCSLICNSQKVENKPNYPFIN